MNDNLNSLPISQQIRRLRKDRGLSLQELAHRAGSSAPALHRYESGWDRFEIATLRRIAAALGARLDIQLRSVANRRPTERPTKDHVVRVLAPLFWDAPLTLRKIKEHPDWVLCRVLEFGDLEQMAVARRYFGDEAIRGALRRRGLDPRTRNFWETLLGESHAPEGTE